MGHRGWIIWWSVDLAMGNDGPERLDWLGFVLLLWEKKILALLVGRKRAGE